MEYAVRGRALPAPREGGPSAPATGAVRAVVRDQPGRGPQGHERDHEDAWSCHGWAPRTSARARRGPGRPPREALGGRGNRASPHAASAELNAVLGCPEPGRRGRRHQQPDGPPPKSEGRVIVVQIEG